MIEPREEGRAEKEDKEMSGQECALPPSLSFLCVLDVPRYFRDYTLSHT